MPALTLASVSKSYGPQAVLKKLSFSVTSGEFVLLLGANGSGKSTILRLCAGLSRADSGKIDFFSSDSASTKDSVSPAALKSRERAMLSAYVGHDSFLYSHLTIQENLELVKNVMGLNSDLSTAMRAYELIDRANTQVSKLSKGLQLRAALCRALLHNPRAILLDESSSALDQKSCNLLLSKLTETVKSPQSAGFVIFATHDIERLKSAATRVIALHEGCIQRDSQQIEKQQDISAQAAVDAVIEYYLSTNR